MSLVLGIFSTAVRTSVFRREREGRKIRPSPPYVGQAKTQLFFLETKDEKKMPKYFRRGRLNRHTHTHTTRTLAFREELFLRPCEGRFPLQTTEEYDGTCIHKYITFYFTIFLSGLNDPQVSRCRCRGPKHQNLITARGTLVELQNHQTCRGGSPFPAPWLSPYVACPS